MLKFKIEGLGVSLTIDQIKNLIQIKILPEDCLNEIINSKKQFDELFKNIYNIGQKLQICSTSEVEYLCNMARDYELKLKRTKFYQVYSLDPTFENEFFYNLNRFDYLLRNIYSENLGKQDYCDKYRNCIVSELDKFYEKHLKELRDL